MFQVGAAEGIGFFFSSGDSGYESPAEDPGSDHDPDRLPAVQPVGDLGRRHQPGHRQGQRTTSSRPPGAPCSTRWPANGKSWQYTPPGPYPDGLRRLRRRRREHRLPAAVLPARRGARQPGDAPAGRHDEPDPDAGGAGRGGAGGPEHRYRWSARPPCSRTGRRTPSRSAGSAAPASPARCSRASRRTPSRPRGTTSASPTRRSTSGTDTAAYTDVTDHPLGPGYLAEVRNNYTDPSTKTGPLADLPAHAGHQRRRRRCAARGPGLRRLDRGRITEVLHPVVLQALTVRRR